MCGGRERSKISSPLIELDVLTTAELSALCYDHQDACLKARSYKILNKCLTLIKRTHRARCAQELSRGEGGDAHVKGMGIFVIYFYFPQNSKNEITLSLTDSWKIFNVLEYGRQWRDLNRCFQKQ